MLLVEPVMVEPVTAAVELVVVAVATALLAATPVEELAMATKAMVVEAAATVRQIYSVDHY